MELFWKILGILFKGYIVIGTIWTIFTLTRDLIQSMKERDRKGVITVIFYMIFFIGIAYFIGVQDMVLKLYHLVF